MYGGDGMTGCTAAAATMSDAHRLVGAVRVASTVSGSIQDVALRNPDGSAVVIAVNDDWSHAGSQRFTLRMGRRAFSYDLPAGGVVTFRLRP